MNHRLSLSSHEKAGLLSLKNDQILDSPTEQAFDDLTALAAAICDAPIASISFVDADRLWFKSMVGIRASEAPKLHAFCTQAIAASGLFVVQDASQDARFAQNHLVTGSQGVRFYAGQPLYSQDGYALGTICVLDTRPRTLTTQQRLSLERLSHQVVLQLQHRFDLIKLDHMGQLLDRTSRMAKVGGWELDLETRQLYWTKEVFAIHALADTEMPTLEQALCFYQPAGQAQLKAAIADAIQHGREWDFELPLTTALKHEIWVRAQGHAIFQGQQAVRLVGAFQDITEQKLNQIKLSWVNRALHLLRHCTQSLLHVKEEQPLVEEVCQLIVREGGYAFAWVGAVDVRADQQITPLGFYGDGAAYLRDNALCWSEDTPIGMGPCGLAIRTGQLVRHDDIQQSSSAHTQLLRSYGYSSVLSLPLLDAHNKVIGLLAIYACEHHQHSDEEIGLISNLAENLSLGLARIRKENEHRRISQAISKLAKALSAVSNDDFFEELVFNMTSTLNADAGYVARLLSSPRLRLQTLSVVVDAQVSPDFEYFIPDQVSQALFAHGNIKCIREGAHAHPVFGQLSLMREHPYEAFAGFRLHNAHQQPFGLLFVFFKHKISESQEHLVRSTISIFASRTASELARLEDALIIQERAALLDKSHDPMVVRDLNHKITYWNQAAEKLYGWSEQEAMQQPVDTLLNIDHSEFVTASRQTIEYGEWFGERVEYHKNGTPMVIETHATLVTDKFGEPRSIFSINNNVTDKKVEENEIRKLAYYDTLTQLPNRRLLMDRLVQALLTSKTSAKLGAVLFIDLDEFKALNDQHGHDAGDLLLQQVAERLCATVRDSDTVARLGGDEFVLLIEGIASEPRGAQPIIRHIADKIIEAFVLPFQLQTTHFLTSPSIGIRLFSGEDHDWEKVLKDADAAMYQSKKQGKNQYTFA